MLIKYLRRRVLRDPQLREIPVRPDTKTPDLSRRVGHFLPRFPGRVFGCDLLRVSPKQAPRTFSSSVSSNIRWAVSRSSIVRVKLRYFLALAKMLATRRFRFTAVPPQIRGPGIENGSMPLTTFAQCYPFGATKHRSSGLLDRTPLVRLNERSGFIDLFRRPMIGNRHPSPLRSPTHPHGNTQRPCLRDPARVRASSA
jgi:hypothetical protein